MTFRVDVLDVDKAGAELDTTVAPLVERLAAPLVITSVDDLADAVEQRAHIGNAIARVVEWFAPLKKSAHQLHADLCERERGYLAPLQALDAARKSAIADYKARADRERETRERELADRQRRDEQTRAAEHAAALERDGHDELAAAVMAEAIAAPAPVVALPDVTRAVAGLSFRRRWLWRYTGGPDDVSKTPPAVAERAKALMPRDYLIPDEKKIGAYVRAMKGGARIPGVDVYYVDDPVR